MITIVRLRKVLKVTIAITTRILTVLHATATDWNDTASGSLPMPVTRDFKPQTTPNCQLRVMNGFIGFRG